MVRALVRVRVPILAAPETVRAVVEAYGKTEAVVEVAMKKLEAKLLVPVAVRRVPFQVRMVLLAEIPVRSSPIVPEVVIVPPVRPLLVATDVTVPEVWLLRHLVVPVTQILAASMPPAKVEEAVEVEKIAPTVRFGVPVATKLVPFQVMRAFVARPDEFTEAWPAEYERPLPKVVVAVHVGTPFRRARTWPAVPADVVARAFVPLPYMRAPAWMLDHPVPPFATVRSFVRLRVSAVRMVPLNVRFAESVNCPPVVTKGTRPDVRELTYRLVVEAVAAVIAVVEAYGNTEAVVDVAKKLPEMNLPALVEEANVRGVVVALFGKRYEKV
jgi:hypothetical protein